MKIVKLTDTEAHLISELFDCTAYPGHLAYSVVREVAAECGISNELGTANLDALFTSIFDKTK